MKINNREVYGYGAKLRTARRIPVAAWVFIIIAAGMGLGAIWT